MKWAAFFFAVLSALFALMGCKRNEEGQANETQVVFRDASGRQLTLGDLRSASGTVQWQVTGGAAIPAEAKNLHEKARSLGEGGDYKKAIELLDRASALAPAWPYPLYDKAFTQLLAGDVDHSLENYHQVDHLVPEGFFTTKTAIWSLEGEKAGTFPTGTYLEYLQLEWVKSDAEKRRRVNALTERIPKFAPAWKESALLQEVPEKRLADLERGLSLGPDLETEGVLNLNRALTLHSLGKHEDCIKLLGTLALATNSTVSTKAMAKAGLAAVLKQK